MDLSLDINCELFPLLKGEKISFFLTKNIELDGEKNFNINNRTNSLISNYEYVMFGKVYKLEDTAQAKM